RFVTLRTFILHAPASTEIFTLSLHDALPIWRRFAFFDALGALLWSCTYIATGFVFSTRLERALASLSFLGGSLLALLLTALGGYIVWKWLNRRRFLRKLRIARISPDELKRRIDAGEDIIIVDLRHALEFDAEPQT